MRLGLFPGTFDPVTLGHMDILARAFHVFDRMLVAVAVGGNKQTLFSLEERIEMLRDTVSAELSGRVDIISFDGLLVDLAREREVSAIVRGLRFVSDFEYEFQMALMNQKLCPEIDTLFLMPTERFTYLNASLVKEVARNGGCVKDLVAPSVAARLKRVFAGARQAGSDRQ